MPIIKTAQKHKYNIKTAQIDKTNSKQTNKKTILEGKIYKSIGTKIPIL
jgi:hypothetical protein